MLFTPLRMSLHGPSLRDNSLWQSYHLCDKAFAPCWLTALPTEQYGIPISCFAMSDGHCLCTGLCVEMHTLLQARAHELELLARERALAEALAAPVSILQPSTHSLLLLVP